MKKKCVLLLLISALLTPIKIRAESFEEIFNQAKQELSKNNIIDTDTLNPKSLHSLLKLAKIYVALKKTDYAVRFFEQAIKTHPAYENTYVALGLVLIGQNKFAQAEHIFKKLLEFSPNHREGLYQLAYSLKMQGKHREAIIYYKKIIRLEPNFSLAHFGLAKSYLASGNFEKGWNHFEWRLKSDNNYLKQFSYQNKSLNDLRNKTILLRAEWGFGDFFQFIRYAKILKDKFHCKVILQTFKSLKKIFKLCDYIDTVISTNEKVPEFDMQIPLLSLPLLFKTNYESIPNQIPYLYADPNLTDYWQKKLPQDNTFKIGLCWQAAPKSALERSSMTRRSVPLQAFSQLADIQNIRFYSLQKTDGINQLNNLPENFKVHTFGKNFDSEHGSFMDTAALIKNLDLVITVDTAVAHLAGALGAKVWVILPVVSEWRWLTKISQSPWYPNMQLFRQSKPNNFTEVINKIKNQIKKTMQT